ncbi:MAG: rhomboid family intramembrane serine protease [Candidatus Aenigmatarchaeota archaeon]
MIFDFWTVRIVVVCTLVFLLQVAYPPLTDYLVLSSSTVLYQPWTLVTSIFAHASFEHIFFNMFGLFLFGMLLENIIGGRRWLQIFFAAGLLGGLVGLPFYDATLGASGAIFGIIGALGMLRPRMTVYLGYVPMPMAIAVIIWAASDIFGFFFPSDIANVAHLAGLVVGLAAGWKLRERFGEVASAVRRYSDGIPESAWQRWEDRYLRRQ